MKVRIYLAQPLIKYKVQEKLSDSFPNFKACKQAKCNIVKFNGNGTQQDKTTLEEGFVKFTLGWVLPVDKIALLCNRMRHYFNDILCNWLLLPPKLCRAQSAQPDTTPLTLNIQEEMSKRQLDVSLALGKENAWEMLVWS